jgi:Lon protease-like protein
MAPISIPLFPLATVLFPEGVLPLQIFEVRYLDMIGRCITSGNPFGVVTLTEGHEVRTPESLEKFIQAGTLATVEDSSVPSPGLLQVVSRGAARFKVLVCERRPNGLWTADVELLPPDLPVRIPSELQGAADALDRVLGSLGDVPERRWPVRLQQFAPAARRLRLGVEPLVRIAAAHHRAKTRHADARQSADPARTDARPARRARPDHLLTGCRSGTLESWPGR